MAASNGTAIPLLNPYTPMAFVPPEIAMNMLSQTYATIGSLAVLLWDIFLNVSLDYRLAKQFGVTFSFILYCISRVTCLAYILGVVITTTAPVGNCNLVRQVSFLSLSVPLSLLPFLMRVSALYRNNKYVVALFSIIWLGVLGCYIATPMSTFGMPMGSSQHCSISRTQLANELTASSVFVYDVLIFIFTSWAFMRQSYSDVSVKNGIRVMVLGRYLPAFSKSILRDGQAYFLIILILNLLFCGLVYVPNSPISACALAFPIFVMLNNMSSHVYRNVRLGFYQDQTIRSSVIINGANQRSRHHHHGDASPTSSNHEDREEQEAGDMNPRKSLAQGTPSQGEVKQRMEV